MHGIPLTEQELRYYRPGEAITLSAVLAVMAIAIVAVVCYKLFTSDNGSAKLPTGWAFTWK